MGAHLEYPAGIPIIEDKHGRPLNSMLCSNCIEKGFCPRCVTWGIPSTGPCNACGWEFGDGIIYERPIIDVGSEIFMRTGFGVFEKVEIYGIDFQRRQCRVKTDKIKYMNWADFSQFFLSQEPESRIVI